MLLVTDRQTVYEVRGDFGGPITGMSERTHIHFLEKEENGKR